jgi:hypothetical protein
LDKPCTIVQRNDYTLTIYHGIAPLEPDNDNVDVQVTFPNGERFSAGFFTLQSIRTLMKRYKKSGECAGGLYFWASDMILVTTVSHPVNRATLISTPQNGRKAVKPTVF